MNQSDPYDIQERTLQDTTYWKFEGSEYACEWAFSRCFSGGSVYFQRTFEDYFYRPLFRMALSSERRVLIKLYSGGNQAANANYTKLS